MGYFAQHLEDANYQLCTRFGGVTPARTAQDSLAGKVAMDGLTDASLAEQLPVGGTRARNVLLFVTDLAEHYSQIASYMRILGLVPPSALRTR